MPVRLLYVGVVIGSSESDATTQVAILATMQDILQDLLQTVKEF